MRRVGKGAPATCPPMGCMVGTLRFAHPTFPYFVHKTRLPCLNIIGLDKHDRFVIELMKYILNIDDEHRDVKDFISLMHNKLQPKLEEELMTLADHIAEKGRQEGLQAGRQEGLQTGRQEGLQTGRQEGIMDVAIKLLQENTDPVFVARITGLPLEQIKKINFSNANGILS